MRWEIVTSGTAVTLTLCVGSGIFVQHIQTVLDLCRFQIVSEVLLESSIEYSYPCNLIILSIESGVMCFITAIHSSTLHPSHGFSVVLYPRSKNRTHSDFKIPYSDLKIELTHRFARNNAFDHHEFQYWWSAFFLQLVVPSFLDQDSTLMPNPASELG